MQPSFFDDTEFAPPRRTSRISGERKVKKPIILGCGACPLGKIQNFSPRMEPFGQGKCRILIVGEAPGATEDRIGRQFIGDAGQLLSGALDLCSLQLHVDCWTTNVVQCRPPENRDPTNEEIRHCSIRLNQQIVEYKPDLILALGAIAAREVLQAPFGISIGQVRGRLFPCKARSCWVGCLYHPSFYRRLGLDSGDYARDLKVVLEKWLIQEGLSKPLSPEIIVCNDFRTLQRMVDQYIADGDEINVDFETTYGGAYTKDALLYTMSFASSPDRGIFIPFYQFEEQKRSQMVEEAFRLLESDLPKSIQNMAFELSWAWKLNRDIRNIVYDTMIGAHVIDSRNKVTSLSFQSFERWGSTHKDDVDLSKLLEESPEDIAKYNVLDACTAWQLAKEQRELMDDATQRAYTFFHSCIPVLTEITRNGIKLDLGEIQRQREGISAALEESEQIIEGLEIVKSYRRLLPDFNYLSGKQLQIFLFSFLKQPVRKKTKKGNSSVDAEVLEEIGRGDDEVAVFCNTLLAFKRWDKLDGTYLSSYEKLVDKEGFLHPNFNLHTTRTFRSSSSNPNFQNVPKHDSVRSQVRRAFVPRFDTLLEVDYSAAEVRCLAMYSKDERLTRYICDGYDMHRTWAAKIFSKPENEISNDERFRAKNTWVFPMFYGSWYEACAEGFRDLGKPLHFFKHLEDEFWGEFEGVLRWQRQYIALYKQQGYVESFLGFRRYQPLKKNKVINTPIQATAFHLLLDGIRRANEEMKRREMKSLLIGQIHDSGLTDVVDSELEEVIAIQRTALTEKRYDWEGSVPLEVEFEVGRNWKDMTPLVTK